MKYFVYHNTKSLMKKAAFYSISVLFFGGILSCDSDGDNIKGGDGYLPYAEPISIELEEKVGTDNAFAFDLFKTTYRLAEESNVFVSPLSVNWALSMTMNGAKGTTLEEVKDVLRAEGYSLDDINAYNKSLREALVTVDKSTTLSIANSIWYNNLYTFENDFISVNRDSYDAEIRAADFNSSNTVNQINDWVSNKTNKKIPKIIEELSPDAMICLINAIYFKGIWREKFNANATKNEDFYAEDGVSMGKVKMMNQTNHFAYSGDENCGYLMLPYGNGAFSMIVMLPHEGEKVDDVISNLDSKSWDNAMNMDSYEVTLRLPCFKAECSYEMQEDILPDMGMIVPFTEFANFGGMIKSPPIMISKVIHKTFIEVNEEGTEAAAATLVEGMVGAPPPAPKIDYVVNRPFAFAIRENSTGVILFIGKIGKIS
jgi:Serine protease inhibitor